MNVDYASVTKVSFEDQAVLNHNAEEQAVGAERGRRAEGFGADSAPVVPVAAAPFEAVRDLVKMGKADRMPLNDPEIHFIRERCESLPNPFARSTAPEECVVVHRPRPFDYCRSDAVCPRLDLSRAVRLQCSPITFCCKSSSGCTGILHNRQLTAQHP